LACHYAADTVLILATAFLALLWTKPRHLMVIEISEWPNRY
jgi:hypothetical protein